MGEVTIQVPLQSFLRAGWILDLVERTHHPQQSQLVVVELRGFYSQQAESVVDDGR